MDEDIVLSPETRKALERGLSKRTCHLCEWILRTYDQNGKLVNIMNFPIDAQKNHIAFEMSQD